MGARAVPVLRHEFVWSFRGAQMPRSAALQMFEQKFRPFTILCGGGASGTMDEHGKRWESEPRGDWKVQIEGIWKALKWLGRTKTTGDETVCNKIVRRENCTGYRDYIIGHALQRTFALTRKDQGPPLWMEILTVKAYNTLVRINVNSFIYSQMRKRIYRTMLHEKDDFIEVSKSIAENN